MEKKRETISKDFPFHKESHLDLTGIRKDGIGPENTAKEGHMSCTERTCHGITM